MSGDRGARFLVEIEVRLPADLPAERRADLLAAELAAGRALVARGAIEGIWRVPGARRNVGVWRAADADELHELVSGLPLFDWMDVRVTPLATHPAAGG